MALNQIIIFILDGRGRNPQRVRDFDNLSMNSHLNQVVETFSMTIIDPDLKIKTGYFVDIRIGENGTPKKILLIGRIQRKNTSVSKTNVIVTISGKNASSMLVESYVHEKRDFNNKTPKFIVDALVNQTSFLNREREKPTLLYSTTQNDSVEDNEDYQKYLRFLYEENWEWKRKNNVKYDDDFKALGTVKNFKISIGDTIWEKISEIVTISGYEVYYKLNGDLHIGDLKKERDDAGVNFSLTHKKNNLNNNVLKASQNEDISDRYPEIHVYSQESQTKKCVKIYDETAPSSSITPWGKDGQKIPGPEKTMTMSVGDDQNPKQIGLATREHQRINGLQITYEVPGFVQNNKQWLKNRLVKVVDDIFGINATLVIYGVTINFNKTAGTITTLKLSMEKDLKSIKYPPRGTGEAEIVE